MAEETTAPAKQKKNNTLLYAILIGGGIYLATKQNNNPFPGYTHLPPGSQYGGYVNNSGTAMWVNAAGQVINVLGEIIGYFTQQNGQTVFTGGNLNPDSGQGHWEDIDGEYVWVPNVSGPKVNCNAWSGYEPEKVDWLDETPQWLCATNYSRGQGF